MLGPAIQALAISSSLGSDPPPPIPPRDDSVVMEPRQLSRTGTGLMIGGGSLMAVGAGILVPISMGIVVNAQPPDPQNYTAVEPFEWDLYAYEVKVHRAMQLGIAGAIVAGVGAATFLAGAVAWGIARSNSASRRRRRARFPG